MKIALLHPSSKQMPPVGYSPVESIIYESYLHLRKNHKVNLIEFDLYGDVLDKIGEDHYDLIHIHYDLMFMIVPVLKTRYPDTIIAMTSHYKHIQDPRLRVMDGRENYYNWVIRNRDVHHFVINTPDSNFLRSQGVDRDKIHTLTLGVCSDRFDTSVPKNRTRSICWSEISQNNRQFLLQSDSTIDFVGPIIDDMGFRKNHTYLGRWTDQQMYGSLCYYSNLVHLPLMDNHTPTSMKSALCAGLGVVTVEGCVDEIDTSLPFIDIIPEDKLLDFKYVSQVIKDNRELSSALKDNIIDYGREKFSWTTHLNNYEDTIKHITKENHGQT